MRVFSFAQESTRYCNYSKDKFNNSITFIIPEWCKSLDPDIIDYNALSITKDEILFLDAMKLSESMYMDLIKKGWIAQQARAVLPNALKTELVMTGFESDWKHFFFLRTPGSAHPQARELAIPLKEEFIKRSIIC